MENKNIILVTGGAGFIGSHLIEALVKDAKNEVYSLDNYFTGSKENHIEGATYIEGETKDIPSLLPITPHIIYHLGEYSRVLSSFDDIEKLWQLNAQGTFAVLEYCKKNNVRLVYAGSSTKFGEFDDTAAAENQTPYAFFKCHNTELVQNYGTWFGLDYAIMYFYNVYGPREISTGSYATVIGIFKEKFFHNEPLTVTNPGTQKRIFTHVADIVRGILLVGEKGSGDGYCIGAEKEYSIKEVAEMFGGEIIMTPARAGDRKYSKIDLTKMKELGWEAKRDIGEYVEGVKN